MSPGMEMIMLPTATTPISVRSTAAASARKKSNTKKIAILETNEPSKEATRKQRTGLEALRFAEDVHAWVLALLVRLATAVFHFVNSVLAEECRRQFLARSMNFCSAVAKALTTAQAFPKG